jgi:T5SS/PEP-CTERM-associated repeat protein
MLLLLAALLLWATAPHATADISTTGQVNPADPSDWDYGITDGYIGDSSDGTMEITLGGTESTVSSRSGYIGDDFGFVGTVSVNGSGATWANSSTLYVGNSGMGTLNITNEGAVSNDFGYIGAEAGSEGEVTVDDEGSTWTMSGTLYVGNSGTGTLDVTRGGAVDSLNGTIALESGSIGAVTVDGEGSTWDNIGALTVGTAGTGTLNITNGGTANNLIGYIGTTFRGDGTVTVDGSGSTWINSGDLTVGWQGRGMLNIAHGGVVSNTIGYIGRNFYSGSVGMASVDGAGSMWSNSGNLFVGDEGTGTLEISNDGLVTVGGTLTIDNANNGNSFVAMSDGGQLALKGDVDNLTDFLALTEGNGAILYYNGTEWDIIDNATEFTDYTLAAGIGGLSEYSVLTVTAVPEPATMSLLAIGGIALIRRRRR